MNEYVPLNIGWCADFRCATAILNLNRRIDERCARQVAIWNIQRQAEINADKFSDFREATDNARHALTKLRDALVDSILGES